jgi:hypothetical protein
MTSNFRSHEFQNFNIWVTRTSETRVQVLPSARERVAACAETDTAIFRVASKMSGQKLAAFVINLELEKVNELIRYRRWKVRYSSLN